MASYAPQKQLNCWTTRHLPLSRKQPGKRFSHHLTHNRRESQPYPCCVEWGIRWNRIQNRTHRSLSFGLFLLACSSTFNPVPPLPARNQLAIIRSSIFIPFFLTCGWKRFRLPPSGDRVVNSSTRQLRQDFMQSFSGKYAVPSRRVTIYLRCSDQHLHVSTLCRRFSGLLLLPILQFNY